MKIQILLLFILLSSIASRAAISLDTISNWQIYYGKVILIQGNTSQTATEEAEIRIKRDVIRELNVSFNYDTKGQLESTLEIKIGGQTVKTLKSVIKDGGFFIIPTRELIDIKAKGKRYKLDLYYSDDRATGNRKLGTLVFIT